MRLRASPLRLAPGPLPGLLLNLCVAVVSGPTARTQPVRFALADTGLTLGPLNGVAFGHGIFGPLNGVAFDHGTFGVSTAAAGSIRVFTSPAGATWREPLVRVQHANSPNCPVRFVNGTTSTASPDAAGSALSTTPNTLRFHNGRFISLLSRTRCVPSTDSVAWSELGASFPTSLSSPTSPRPATRSASATSSATPAPSGKNPSSAAPPRPPSASQARSPPAPAPNFSPAPIARAKTPTGSAPPR